MCIIRTYIHYKLRNKLTYDVIFTGAADQKHLHCRTIQTRFKIDLAFPTKVQD